MGKVPPDLFSKRLEGDPELVSVFWRREDVFCLLEIQPQIVLVQNSIQ
jgi:hypothetical protein